MMTEYNINFWKPITNQINNLTMVIKIISCEVVVYDLLGLNIPMEIYLKNWMTTGSEILKIYVIIKATHSRHIVVNNFLEGSE